MAKEKNRRRSYTEEFKRDAVTLVTEQGYKYAEAGRSLGIKPDLIRRWRQEFGQEMSGEHLSADEREELKRLRRRVRELEMEQEILKKASAYFARQLK